ncbi:MAG: hypothetical protein LBD44_03325, partial [Spirochaetaceae bacterium]|nr:hypothetical protein [Spirochaetaceae bacterium]
MAPKAGHKAIKRICRLISGAGGSPLPYRAKQDGKTSGKTTRRVVLWLAGLFWDGLSLTVQS